MNDGRRPGRRAPLSPLARALRWLVPLRVPLALAGALVTLPALADVPAARLFLGNLFVLGTPELAVVGLTAPLAAWTAVRIGRLVVAGASARSGVPAWPWPPRRPRLGAAALVAALAAPVVVTALVRSSDGPSSPARLAAHALALTLGALVGAAAIVAGERLGRAPWPRRWLARLGPGYDDPEAPALAAGHTAALGSLVLFGLGYAGLGLAFHPAAAPDGCLTRLRVVDGGLCFPALGYVLVVASLAAWVLGAAAFWLDRYGVPLVVVVALAALPPLAGAGADHVYRTAPRNAEPVAAPLTPADVVRTIAARQGGAPRLVVVAASGGGSAAALWTATVLTRLEAAAGRRWTDALSAVSASSGGSFGALLYLAPPFDGAPRPPATRAAIRAAAAQPTLRPVAWGLAYPDLWRFAPWPRARARVLEADRGWAMEAAWSDVWRRTLRRGDPAVTLGGWRAAVRRGELPAPIFHAMAVETGRQMLLTPLDLPAAGPAAPYDTFLGTYPERDLPAITAARLSAAFPWISPQPRPDCDCPPAWHLADGGYFDNDGVAGAMAFLDAALPAFAAVGGREVLVVQIRVSFDRPVDPAAVPRRGWPFAALGPLEALLSARGAVQGRRNAEALARLAERWAVEGVTVAHAETAFVLDGGGGVPLSWQLTHTERAAVEAAWEAPEARRAAAAVGRFLGQP